MRFREEAPESAQSAGNGDALAVLVQEDAGGHLFAGAFEVALEMFAAAVDDSGFGEEAGIEARAAELGPWCEVPSAGISRPGLAVRTLPCGPVAAC